MSLKTIFKNGSLKERTNEYMKIIENPFMGQEKCEIFTNLYVQILSIKRRFLKLVHYWRWKKASVYNTEDLWMNPVYEGQKNTMTILQNNRKYVFSLRELISNINRELSNSPDLFTQPLPCKNPYTNQFFGKSTLYNIYFAIKDSTFIMPPLLHHYFLSNFHLLNFMNENEEMIRGHYLDKYTDKVTHDIIHNAVKNMFSDNKIKITISPTFPADRLKRLMEPYLKLYYISKYSMNNWKKMNAHVKLYRQRKKLQKNPA